MNQTHSKKIQESWYCTCKPDFDQIQRVKHKRGHHTSAQSRHQVSDFDMTEHLLGVCAEWDGRRGFAGHSRFWDVAGPVVLSRAHVADALDPVG